MSHNELGLEDERDAWAILRSFAASSGVVIIATNAPPKDGKLEITPEVRVQLADTIARAAVGHLQRGSVTEAKRYCRAALFHDRDCQPARACELALLRGAGKRSYADDIGDVAASTRDPFIVALSYSFISDAATQHLEAQNRAHEKHERYVTAAMLLAGFFYWHALKATQGSPSHGRT